MSQQQLRESEAAATPDKTVLATVLSYLRNKNLKETEEALKKELGVHGQTALEGLSGQSLHVSSIGHSGTEPAKYEESYTSPTNFTPSTSTRVDVQPAIAEDFPQSTYTRTRSTTSTSTTDQEEQDSKDDQTNGNRIDSEKTTVEDFSKKSSLLADTRSQSWPGSLQSTSVTANPRLLNLQSLSPPLPPQDQSQGLGANTTRTTANLLTSPPTSVLDNNPPRVRTTYDRSISSPANPVRVSDTDVLQTNQQQAITINPAAAQIPVGTSLMYQLATAGQTLGGLRQPILTPILTVLPSSSLVNASTIQAGGQPLLFNTSQPQPIQGVPMLSQLVKSPEGQSSSIESRSDRAILSQPLGMNKPIAEPTTGQTLTSPVEPVRVHSGQPSSPRTLASLMLSEMTPQYLELKSFAEEFKTKRIRLGYTQGAVGQSLANRGYSNFAQSTISRFEQMQLSPTNAAAIKQVLEKWLHEAECPESQSSVSSSTSAGPLMANRKRKKRAVYTTQVRASLDEYFKQNPRPNRQLIESIANELDLLPEEVRVWFCNKRQKTKHNLQNVYNYSYDREVSHSTASSCVNSPPSLYETAKRSTPSPKTPFTIEELSKSSGSTTTSPALSTSPIRFPSIGLGRPVTTPPMFSVVISDSQPTSSTTLPQFMVKPSVETTRSVN